MPLIKATKSEFNEITKLCQDQAQVIQDQKDLIEKMGFELLINKGWGIRTTLEYLTQGAQIIHMMIVASSTIPVPAESPDMKAEREKRLSEYRQAHERICINLRKWEAAWKEFTETHRDFAEVLIEKMDLAPLGKMEG